MSHIVTLTGPSGVGKSYVKRELKELFNLEEIPVYTTRPARSQNDDGRIFLSEEDFFSKLLSDDLLAINKIYGSYYAFSRQHINDIAVSPKDFISELYVSNIMLFRTIYPTADMIAMLPDSLSLIEERLKKRGESGHDISKRMEKTEYEMQWVRDNRALFDVVYMVSKDSERYVVPELAYIIEGRLKC